MLKVSSRLFPIGFIISVDNANFNPHDFYIDGNWERIKGRVIVGVDEAQTEFNVTGKTGGAKTHTLTEAQIPPHTHRTSSYSFTGYTTGSTNRRYPVNWNDTGREVDWSTQTIGGGLPHNNTQPYQTAYMWKLISYSN